MTATITFPATLSRVGPGTFITCHTTIGPANPTDLWVAEVDVGALTVLTAIRSTAGFTSRDVFLGVFDPLPPGAGQFLGVDAAVAGATCSITATLYNATLTSVTDGPVTLSGLVWDPLSALWAHILNSVGGAGNLAGILDAVKRTYPAT